jgi:hypothetical protein
MALILPQSTSELDAGAWLVPSVFNNEREQLLRITKEKGYDIAHHLLQCGNTWSKDNQERLKILCRDRHAAGIKKDVWGNSLFHWAALANSTWAFPCLADGLCIPTHTKNDMGLYPINVAIYMNNSDILDEFIQHGLANSNGCDAEIEVTLHVPGRENPTQRDPLQVHLNPLAYAYMHGRHCKVLQDYQNKYRCIQTFVHAFGDILFLVVHFDHVDLLRHLTQTPGSMYDYAPRYGWARLMINSHNGMSLAQYAQAVGADKCVSLLTNTPMNQ